MAEVGASVVRGVSLLSGSGGAERPGTYVP